MIEMFMIGGSRIQQLYPHTDMMHSSENAYEIYAFAPHGHRMQGMRTTDL